MEKLTGPQVVQLLAVRAAIKLEAKGLRHSSGRSIRKAWALKMGLPARAKHEAVIKAIEKKIEEGTREDRRIQ